MMQIFGFFGSILGYVLWAAWYIVRNFGAAIIIFTILIKLVLFPFTVKQQKTMAKNARMQKKQQEIREKYANNRQKQQEEIQKLYERENMSMTGGCLTSIIPMLIMFGIIYSVAFPLTNTLHIDANRVSQLSSYVNTIPGYIPSGNSFYAEIDLLRIFPSIANASFITGLFTPAEIQNIIDFGGSFNLFGFDLLSAPNGFGLLSVYILIPVLCFVTSVISQVITMRINGTQHMQQGCMKIMIYVLPLFSAWIAYTVPAAVGFYWIMSYLITLLQSLVLAKFYNPVSITAKSEAQHVALLELKEAQVPRIYAPSSVNKGNNKNNKNKKK
ncbi:MAG: YidC/Oxa1 family membrane protein insertase [Ruminococcus sp.]|nr:YidC/Oxa1 family membrane protein insertase [Ruminococcus sp.]